MMTSGRRPRAPNNGKREVREELVFKTGLSLCPPLARPFCGEESVCPIGAAALQVSICYPVACTKVWRAAFRALCSPVCVGTRCGLGSCKRSIPGLRALQLRPAHPCTPQGSLGELGGVWREVAGAAHGSGRLSCGMLGESARGSCAADLPCCCSCILEATAARLAWAICEGEGRCLPACLLVVAPCRLRRYVPWQKCRPCQSAWRTSFEGASSPRSPSWSSTTAPPAAR